MRPDPIYQLLAAEFARLGVAGPRPISRTAIFHGRYFVGHLFRCEQLRAVWFVDSGVVKFYDANRKPLREVKLDVRVRKAA
jgi:hypothetical protein